MENPQICSKRNNFNTYHLKYESASGHTDHSPEEHTGNGKAVHAPSFVKKSARNGFVTFPPNDFKEPKGVSAHLLISL